MPQMSSALLCLMCPLSPSLCQSIGVWKLGANLRSLDAVKVRLLRMEIVKWRLLMVIDGAKSPCGKWRVSIVSCSFLSQVQSHTYWLLQCTERERERVNPLGSSLRAFKAFTLANASPSPLSASPATAVACFAWHATARARLSSGACQPFGSRGF